MNKAAMNNFVQVFFGGAYVSLESLGHKLGVCLLSEEGRRDFSKIITFYNAIDSI